MASSASPILGKRSREAEASCEKRSKNENVSRNVPDIEHKEHHDDVYPRRQSYQVPVKVAEAGALALSAIEKVRHLSHDETIEYFSQLFRKHHLSLTPSPTSTAAQERKSSESVHDDTSSSTAAESWWQKHEMNLQQRLCNDGYFQVGARRMQTVSDDQCVALADATADVVKAGWPPSFMMLCDEMWQVVHCLEKVIAKTSGGNQNCHDTLLWYVDPQIEAQHPLVSTAGFSPHRDRQPEQVEKSFRADPKTPLYTTCWMPLTDACPDNSCLYVLPAGVDPGYWDGDLPDPAPNPLERALISKEQYQWIRCLPAPRGSACIFSHRIIHWGSSGRIGYHTPRISLSIACADKTFEPPYTQFEGVLPPFHIRFALVCGQMICYHDRFSFLRKQLLFFREIFERYHESFHATFIKKVRYEFVSAVSAFETQLVENNIPLHMSVENEKEGPTIQINEDHASDSEGELEDAMLDTLLQQELAGENVYDDFDDEADSISFPEEKDDKHDSS